jgi:hypothetical protein
MLRLPGGRYRWHPEPLMILLGAGGVVIHLTHPAAAIARVMAALGILGLVRVLWRHPHRGRAMSVTPAEAPAGLANRAPTTG